MNSHGVLRDDSPPPGHVGDDRNNARPPLPSSISTEKDYFEMARSFGLVKEWGGAYNAAQTSFATDNELSDRIAGFANMVGFHVKSSTTGGTTRVYTCKSSPECPFLITTNISNSTGITRISRRLHCFRHNHPLGNAVSSFAWSDSRDALPKRKAFAAFHEEPSQDDAPAPAPPQVCTEDEYFAVARAIGLCRRTGPSSVRPVNKVFESKEDLLERIHFLACRVGFQIKHRDGTFRYVCKSVADCPFSISINVRPSGTAKLSEKLCFFPHNHPFGVLDQPSTGKNTTLNSAIIAYSIAASGMDWAKATHMDFRNHCIATFGVPIGPTRSTTVRRELEEPGVERHIERYKKLDDAMRTALERIRAHASANPHPPDAKDNHAIRREMHHRWEIDRRRLAMDEQRHARAENEARIQHRVLLAKLHEAEVNFKVTKAKARHELLAVGLSPADIDAALA
ncbi:hypothetical protein LEN26_007920 [Aphanomyces euteiches]|nr:hypothetical protein AeMF1_002701 [Aphanomyces euteiches]KAH9131116.1 hypothetical protein LEN26_007920 [Aphanomyces euteiches]KAH9195749.1 hypothetical protein AeNC1_002255 [Aphanomyces euteiches]